MHSYSKFRKPERRIEFPAINLSTENRVTIATPSI